MVDFYSQVPKTLEANLAYRVNLRKKAAKDAGLRRAIKQACDHDILYFFNGWCWLHETRVRFDQSGKRLPHVIPFITRSHQDEYFRFIETYLGVSDIGIKKCRDEGFSWGGVLFAVRDWLCKEDVKIGLVSSTEKKSDDPGNMDSLGAKIDWELRRFPEWFKGREGEDWERNKVHHSWVNVRNSTSINAFAASGDTGRGGRYLWFLLDEFASRDWQESNKDKAVLEALFGATDSKLIISTPEGQFGEFYRMMTQPSSMARREMNWRNNPVKARGLYRLVNNKPVAADPVNDPLPAHYDPPTQEVQDRWSRLRTKGFNLEKDTRSQWYDETCDKPEATIDGVAKNVDAEWGGSIDYIFDDEFFKVANRTVSKPLHRGTLTVTDDGKWSWGESEGGQFQLWCRLDAHKRPPMSQYIVSLDLAHGRGGRYSANSALHVIDAVRKEQVAEFAVNTIEPLPFTNICLGVCDWFWGAYFAWEHNQPGNVCTDRVRDKGYSNYYRRKTQDAATQKVTQYPGWWTDDKTKELMFSDLLVKIKTGEFIVHSRALVDECGQYIRNERGKIVHSSESPGHGDRVMSLGVGLQALKDRPNAKPLQSETAPWLDDREPPPNTLAHLLWKQQQGQRSIDIIDRRSHAELAGVY